MQFSISKPTPQKLPIQIMFMTGGISEVTPKVKAKSNPLANQNPGSSQNLWLVSSLAQGY